MWTRLLYRNRSSVAQPPSVLLWQDFTQDQRGTTGLVSRPWQLIQRCGHGMSHDVRFSHQLQALVGDGTGNQSRPIDLNPGREYKVVGGAGSARLVAGTMAGAHRYSVSNESTGPIRLSIQRDGLVAAECWLGVGNSTVWEDDYELKIVGVTWRPRSWSSLLDGSFLRPEILRLHGILRADVVMLGGGAGVGSRPLSFHLNDVESW